MNRESRVFGDAALDCESEFGEAGGGLDQRGMQGQSRITSSVGVCAHRPVQS